MAEAARTRIHTPGWRFELPGVFRMDLSWLADSCRWLEVRPGSDGWRAVLCEAADDGSWVREEPLTEPVDDVTTVLTGVELDPWPYDRPPWDGTP